MNSLYSVAMVAACPGIFLAFLLLFWSMPGCESAPPIYVFHLSPASLRHIVIETHLLSHFEKEDTLRQWRNR